MAELNVGDIVVMKSGGPKMTVLYVSDEPTDMIQCRWYDGKKFQTQLFPPESINRYDESESGVYVV